MCVVRIQDVHTLLFGGVFFLVGLSSSGREAHPYMAALYQLTTTIFTLGTITTDEWFDSSFSRYSYSIHVFQRVFA